MTVEKMSVEVQNLRNLLFVRNCFAKDKYKVMIGDEDSSSEARVKKM